MTERKQTTYATRTPPKVDAVGSQVDQGVGRHPWAAEMLSMLNDRWGTTTGDLAQRHSRLQHWGNNRHQQSASALAVLRQLEAEGAIKKLDAEKPIAWVLVTPNVGIEPPKVGSNDGLGVNLEN